MGALWDYFSGKLESEGRVADERLDQLNSQRAPLYGAAWSEEIATNRGRSTRADTYDAEVKGAFVEGAKEGADNVQNVISGGINSTVGFVSGSIPAVGWLLILGALFLYAGGGVWLKGILARR